MIANYLSWQVEHWFFDVFWFFFWLNSQSRLKVKWETWARSWRLWEIPLLRMEVSFQKMNFKLNLIILWVRLTFNNVFNKRNFAFYNFSTLPWETNHTVFSLDKIREQVRGEMENVSEKISEEGMLIPNSITWTPCLLITIFQSALTNMMTCVKKLPLKSFNNLWTIVT